MSSSCWEENTAACSCTASLAPRAAGKGPACGPVVFHICLRSPVTLDSWEGCDSSHYSPAHISHLNWEGKWPSLPFSLDAALGHSRTLTRSLELSSSLLSGPSLSRVATHTQRLDVVFCFFSYFVNFVDMIALTIPFPSSTRFYWFLICIVKFACICLPAPLLHSVTGPVSEVWSLPTVCASARLSSPFLPVNLPSVCCGL